MYVVCGMCVVCLCVYVMCVCCVSVYNVCVVYVSVGMYMLYACGVCYVHGVCSMPVCICPVCVVRLCVLGVYLCVWRGSVCVVCGCVCGARVCVHMHVCEARHTSACIHVNTNGLGREGCREPPSPQHQQGLYPGKGQEGGLSPK